MIFSELGYPFRVSLVLLIALDDLQDFSEYSREITLKFLNNRQMPTINLHVYAPLGSKDLKGTGMFHSPNSVAYPLSCNTHHCHLPGL